LVFAGPYNAVPVLENTANPVFTISTICVDPTEAFGSGGTPVTENEPCGPVKPCPRPSKLAPSDGTAGLVVVCTTGSGWCALGCCGIRCTGSFSRRSVPTGTAAMLRNGIEWSL
jgi:hypothetical protein